ncbi:twin-arginine translocase subunit TatC [Phytopseudomonas seleniipraecipitans]|uniref:Sec-independent protein translocase protein TatC n=1 Tax=Phytopseudomonas seleniipraecipitans TaxID=640205 RepID=A0A1G7H0D9_9GAMM|nr:twin-arginine translocase subunit TatC [Pseudomonas seleniipraecipitans]NQD81018.1 twin-arginine translocase subunit TatC [Pseudomonas sp. CrR14]SDE93892.1 Sec-independent protein translocase TatC [Pseudomonas seleniipraecipitans]
MSDMPLTAHLGELRKRLVRCLLVILLAFLGLFPFAQTLYTMISEPLRRYLPEGASMIATSVTSPFLAPFKLTLMVAVFISMPVLLHQAWGFVAPGLYRRERRIAVPLLVSSILLFYAGMAFAFFAVFPMMFGFFASVTPDGVEMMTDIALYLDFILALFLAFGLAFEIPVATFIIVWAGLTDVDTLRRSRPYVIVGCFVVGMMLTPPDVFSQTMLAVPMWLLFEVGLLACGSIQRRPEQESEQELAVTD